MKKYINFIKNYKKFFERNHDYDSDLLKYQKEIDITFEELKIILAKFQKNIQKSQKWS